MTAMTLSPSSEWTSMMSALSVSALVRPVPACRLCVFLIIMCSTPGRAPDLSQVRDVESPFSRFPPPCSTRCRLYPPQFALHLRASLLLCLVSRSLGFVRRCLSNLSLPSSARVPRSFLVPDVYDLAHGADDARQANGVPEVFARHLWRCRSSW